MTLRRVLTIATAMVTNGRVGTRSVAFVVIASDGLPHGSLRHLRLSCEARGVPYVFVASKRGAIFTPYASYLNFEIFKRWLLVAIK